MQLNSFFFFFFFFLPATRTISVPGLNPDYSNAQHAVTEPPIYSHTVGWDSALFAVSLQQKDITATPDTEE
jgi:hypothetical protein